MSHKYQEIADDLRRRIESGEWPTGTTLPKYEDLTKAYTVGRGVISEALAILEAEGLVSVAKRSGITVRERGQRRRVQRGSLVSRDSRGYLMPAAAGPGEPWQVHGRPVRDTLPITARAAELLGLESGTDVICRSRVTSPTGEPPFQLVVTWVHPLGVTDAPQVAEKDTGQGGYLDRLEEAGHGPLTWVEYERVRMPTPDEARQIKMPRGMPVMEIARVGTSGLTDEPIEVTICVIPADRVEIVRPLRRARSAQWPRNEDDR